MDEKMEVEAKCADAIALTKEEKLKNYKTKLEKNLKRELDRIELDAEFDKIEKEFKETHADEFKKIEEHDKCKRLSYADEAAESNRPTIPIEDIDALKRRYKELESRQIEILENATNIEKLEKTPTDQMNAMVDEYISAEKLKLILIDRIRGALTNRCIKLNCDKFSKYNLSFEKGTDID